MMAYPDSREKRCVDLSHSESYPAGNQAGTAAIAGRTVMHRYALIALVATVLAMPMTSQATAQQAGDAYYVVTYIETAPGSRAQTAELIKKFGEASRNDAGNLRFETLRRIGVPYHFAILEAWKDKAAADAHAAAAHTKTFRDSLNPSLTAPYDERPHGALSAAAPKLDAGARTIYSVTHVDIIPPKKDEGIAATSGLAEPGRKERGNLRFEVVQQASRPNHMTVVEAWRSRRAQQAHAETAGMKAYRDKLLPMSGSLYDERQYRTIGESRARPRPRKK
jgi:quinol monooxygenase YgiN